MNINVIARSDSAGIDVIGSTGSPQALTVDNTYVTQVGATDTRDYSDCVWLVETVTQGSATKLTVKVEWLHDSSVTDTNPQGSESISSGLSTLSVYEAEYTLLGTEGLPAISLPVAGPYALVSIKADLTGTNPGVIVRVWRKA
jgi:hypothetical protein